MTKPCPQCGYERTKTDRGLLALYRKHFRGIPVWDMIHRGWIRSIDDPKEHQTDLDGFIAGTFMPSPGIKGMVCNTEPERIL